MAHDTGHGPAGKRAHAQNSRTACCNRAVKRTRRCPRRERSCDRPTCSGQGVEREVPLGPACARLSPAKDSCPRCVAQARWPLAMAQDLRRKGNAASNRAIT
eukprot:15449473-Alexandrium_andersonii.AAC.1